MPRERGAAGGASRALYRGPAGNAAAYGQLASSSASRCTRAWRGATPRSDAAQHLQARVVVLDLQAANVLASRIDARATTRRAGGVVLTGEQGHAVALRR